MTTKDSMGMHTGNGCCSSYCNPLCSHSGISGFRKNRKGQRRFGFFRNPSISALKENIPYEPSTEMHVHGYLWMRLCFLTVALAPYRPWFPSYNGFVDFGKRIYKRIRPEKVEGFPDRIRLANYAGASVFLRISGSMVNPVLLDYRNPSSIFAENPQCSEYEKTT